MDFASLFFSSLSLCFVSLFLFLVFVCFFFIIYFDHNLISHAKNGFGLCVRMIRLNV